jgi:hypothetical protein
VEQIKKENLIILEKLQNIKSNYNIVEWENQHKKYRQQLEETNNELVKRYNRN